MGGLPLASQNQADIDHIRLSFFQIRIESSKRGLPGFQMYMILFLGGISKQTRHNWVDLSDSDPCIAIGPQT